MPGLHRWADLVCIVLLPSLTVPSGRRLHFLKVPFLICKIGINKQKTSQNDYVI